MILRAEESQTMPGTFHVYDVDASEAGPRVALIVPGVGASGPEAVKSIVDLVNGARPEPPALTDTVLTALAALVQEHAQWHAAELANWVANNPPGGCGTGPPPPAFGSWAADKIEAELKRRGVLP